MDPSADFEAEDIENLHSSAYDGPQPYNYEPPRRQREQEPLRVRRNNGHRREIELWCEENEWRAGQVSW